MAQIPVLRDVFLEVLNDRFRGHPSARRLQRRNVRCFDCQQTGHYRSECAHWKTRICWNWMNMRCCESTLCSFAHGSDELRGL